jgi:predicted RND superfamily exporter protein
MKIALILALALSMPLVGCVPSRIKGGTVEHYSTTGSKTVLVQSDDPKERSMIDGASEKSTEFVIPAGSVVQLEVPQTVQSTPKTILNSPKAKPSSVAMPPVPTPQVMNVVLASNAVMKTSSRDSMKTVSGAAQKNVIGEMGAKLASLRPVQFVGVALLLFGLASMFWLPLRAIVGSHTTSLVIAATGLGLIVLPILIVGNEVLILLIGLGCAAGYFFVYRYSQASTKAKVYKDFIDLNGNKVDDRLEKPEEKVETSAPKV